MQVQTFKTVLFPLLIPTLLLSPFPLVAGDLVRVGGGARGMGMGNVAGLANDPIAAISTNPAFLSHQQRSSQVSLHTVYVDSEFTSSLGETDKADSGPGMIPDAAIAWPIENTPWTLGAGIHVQSAMLASFEFTDPPGTLGVTYGQQDHEASFAVINTAAAVSYAVNDNLSIGVQAGIAYNRNQLKSPYIFQSHPGLAGLKVLVDLDVDDYSPSFAVGIDYKAENNTRLYASYTLENEFDATGSATGNLGQLGLFAQEDFNYNAAVKTAMPAYAVGGIVWPASDKLTLGAQLDWINWEDAFYELPLALTNGTNTELNTFLGSSGISDTAPLRWDNQLTLHIGGEFSAGGNRLYRAGYEYSTVPVPTSTMTPMTGAILRHGVSAGMSISFDSFVLDLSYRASFDGGKRWVNTSELLAGEYSNTSLELMLHNVGIAFRF